jgi:hypothetical protein
MSHEQPRNYHVDCEMLTNESAIPMRLSFRTWTDDETGERGCEIQFEKKSLPHRMWVALSTSQARSLASRLKAAAKWMATKEQK